MSNYTTTAAATRISSSAVVEDTHIEEQLNGVRLDGEKSPLTSPKRGGRPSKQKVSAFKEGPGEKTTTTTNTVRTPSSSSQSDDGAYTAHYEQQYQQYYAPATNAANAANSYEYTQHGGIGENGGNENFMYVRQMYEYEMALRQQMSYATGSPEQMMPLLVGSPPGGPPPPLMGGFDPNEFARMQQAQQMNAAYAGDA
jgi:hypothetical protein